MKKIQESTKEEREEKAVDKAFEHFREHPIHPDPEDVDRDIEMLEELEKISKPKGVHSGAEG